MSIDPKWLGHPWPSIQRGSQMIVERSGNTILLLAARERLGLIFKSAA